MALTIEALSMNSDMVSRHGGSLSLSDHMRIVGALMMRETVTRYGRQGLGLLWLVGEPLIFCFGVILMWSLLRPEYEHGIRVAPFIMTGYMCLLLLRHLIGANMNALLANGGLLYHRKISVLHIYMSRCVLEIASNTLAFIVVYFTLFVLGQVVAPENILLFYSGWFLLAWMCCGIAFVFAGLAFRFELFERVSPVIQYSLIPLSGVFTMLAWVPAKYREALLWIPIPHAVEMVRAGMFGEFTPTTFDPVYAIGWAAGLNFFGLILLARAKHHLEME
jgi:capsular polysaccharide transport system permease protein